MTRTLIALAASFLLTGAAVASDDVRDTYDTRGEFIRAKLDEGLRGDALAEAILVEWEGRKGASGDDMSEQRLQKLVAKATAKHEGKPESTPRD